MKFYSHYALVITIYLCSYLDMSEHSEHEWKRYILTKSIFGNALRFAHLEKPEDADRTSNEGAEGAVTRARDTRVGRAEAGLVA